MCFSRKGLEVTHQFLLVCVHEMLIPCRNTPSHQVIADITPVLHTQLLLKLQAEPRDFIKQKQVLVEVARGMKRDGTKHINSYVAHVADHSKAGL